MPVVPSFIGPSNTAWALNVMADRTINAYEESTEPGNGKAPRVLRKAPGLSVFANTGGSGVNVPDVFAQDGRMWAVSGNNFLELFSDGSWTVYGTVSTLPNIVPTMCSNGTAGHQVFLTSGLNGYIFDTIANTLTLIADIDFPQGEALAGEFMDGYFLVLIYQSRRYQISALFDGTDWDGLDVAERSEGSDNLVDMVRNHREMWFPGSKTGEVWYDNGDPDFPFAPVQGVFLEQGAAASFTMKRVGNTVVWVGTNEQGAGIVWIANGYSPVRISTFPVEDAIQTAGPDGCRAWTYQEDGHEFYVLHCDNNETTWAYDLTLNRWHERAVLENDAVEPWVWSPNRPISHAYCFGKHLVGDRLTGTIYEQSSALLSQDLADV